MTPYAHDELVLIVPRHHELAKRGSIAMEELYTLPLVSLNQVRCHILQQRWMIFCRKCARCLMHVQQAFQSVKVHAMVARCASPSVCLAQGSSVQLVQEKLLRQHGILWRHLRIDMVG